MGRPLREVLEDPGVLEELKRNPEGFVYKQVVPPDVSWGVRSPNGTWSGMVRQVVQKEVDMALGPFQVIESRNQDIDFSIPFFFDTLSFMVARGSAEIDPWGFLMPFTASLWAAFFIGLLTIVLAHFLFDLTQGPTWKVLPRFGSLLFEYIQPPMGHALHRRATKSWHRPLLGSWVLVSLLLNVSYDGTLRSLMALRHIPHPIQTIGDAIKDTSRKLIIEHRTSFTDILGRVPSGDIRKLDDEGKKGRYIDLKMRDFMNYYPLVRDKGHIQIFDVSTSLLYFDEYFSLTGRCDFYIAKEKFIPTMYAMVNWKRSPLTPAIDARIRRLVEAGLYNYWVYNDSSNITACANPPMKVALMDPIGIGSIWGVSVIWAVGMTLATIVLIVEVMVSRLTGNKCEAEEK
ncbi:glutamate receptor ionotropic, delta-2-like isoform X1 [Palaemon carinicauda]|uniref:glutamate receptor ionotropic, delta-2-like isoform X1 n=1 Tax=Palaemon carinicauda TaxID=392227 RepID=UPI0035B64D9B